MIELINSAIRLSVPTSFVALGEVFGERAGVINIGIEGIMLLCCLAAAAVAEATGSVVLGFVGAAVAGVVVLALQAFLMVLLKANQIVVGLGTNLAALGITTLYVKANPQVQQAPNLDPLDLPGVLGQNLCFYGLLLTVPLTLAVLHRTSWGLRVRSVGEAPAAADAAGIAVDRVRLQAMLVGGALCGIGGAALAIGDLQGFTENMVSGKGFIALAAVIFGRWNPALAVAGCGVFGLASAVQFRVSSVFGWTVPSSLLQMLPFVAVLVALALQRSGGRAPSALSVPYERRR